MFFKKAVQFLRKPTISRSGTKLQYCDKKPTKLDDEESKERLKDMKNPIEKDILHIITIEKAQEISNKCKLAKECDSMIVGKKILISNSNFHLVSLMAENNVIKSVVCEEKSVEHKIETDDSSNYTKLIRKLGPIRQDPGKVVWGFIPHEWVDFFYPKTGVTGFYTFLIAFTTFLVSKEHYVLEHNFYNGLSWAIMAIVAIKKFGPRIANYCDKEIENYENEWKEARKNAIKQLEEAIKHEERLQFEMDGQLILIAAKRENVDLQLEIEYRERLKCVQETIEKRLNYHIHAHRLWKRLQHQNLVEYVLREVKNSLATAEQQKAVLEYSIDEIIAEFERQTNEKPFS